MAQIHKDGQIFTVARVFFLLIVIPLSLMAILIGNGIFKLGVTVKERTVTLLDQKSQEEIKIRAVNTAAEVANFLREREKDLLIATIIPVTESAYREFVQDNRKPIWTKQEGKIVQVSVPLYREMAFIDRNGVEQIKVVDGQVVPPSRLVDVSKPANTTFKSEGYFAAVKQRNKRDVYVSPVTGWYVNRSDVQQGKRFSGIVRMATPVFDSRGFAGALTLALDARHLAAFTDHIIPTQAQHVFEADAATGNYAYMADNEGFVISHPYDFHIRGLYPDGAPVPALTEENAKERTAKGEEVLNLNLLGFLDPNLPEIARDAAAGKSGVKLYKFGGRTKFVAYAPIAFFSRDCPSPAGFGWVGMGVDVEKYNELAVAASKNIEKEARSWTTTIVIILVASMVLLFLILWLLTRGITRSLEEEVPEGSQGGPHMYDDEEDDK